MIFSKATGYGIRALVYLARRPENRLCGLEEIASSEQIPPVFLRKVLGDLRRRRLLRSVKGIHGGYALARSAESITLWEVIDSPGAGADFDLCILGCGTCSSDDPCPLHLDWQKLRDELVRAWQLKTISDIATASKTEPTTASVGARSGRQKRAEL